MALTQAQRQAAQLIMGLAAQRGLGVNRQRELAAIAMAESGLNPNARNTSSGAAGYFQLLSSGYVNKAKQLGGLYNPRANTLAILPDYINYWRQHPNAPPGAAGRDVERSGMGADFYAKSLPMFGGVGPGSVSPSQVDPAGPGTPAAPALPNFSGAVTAMRNLVVQNLSRGQNLDPTAFASIMQRAIRQRQQAAAAAPADTGNDSSSLTTEAPGTTGTATGSKHALAEAFYDPLGSWDSGRFGGPIGGHSDHVHLSITNPQVMIAAIHQAQQMGLRVGENPYTDKVDPVHVTGSFHYKDFPGRYSGKQLGEAIDVSGSPDLMARYYRWATGNLR